MWGDSRQKIRAFVGPFLQNTKIRTFIFLTQPLAAGRGRFIRLTLLGPVAVAARLSLTGDARLEFLRNSRQALRLKCVSIKRAGQ